MADEIDVSADAFRHTYFTPYIKLPVTRIEEDDSNLIFGSRNESVPSGISPLFIDSSYLYPRLLRRCSTLAHLHLPSYFPGARECSPNVTLPDTVEKCLTGFLLACIQALQLHDGSGAWMANKATRGR